MEKVVSVEGKLRLLSEEGSGLLQRVEVLLLNSKVNRNNWQYLNLQEHKSLFAQTPILIAYKGKQIGDGHNFDEVINPDGSVTASFMSATAERIVGWFNSAEDIRIETIDDIEWIVGIGYISKWYAPELVAKLNGQGVGKSEMSISIETLIDEMHMDGNTEVFTKYRILGTTILGDSVAPAVADASIRALSAIGLANLREMTLRVANANNPQPDEDEQSESTAQTGRTKRQKGLKRRMNKVGLKALESKFPNHRVLAVSDDKVLLANSNDALFMSTYTSNDDGFDVTETIACNAVVTIGEGEDSVSFDLTEIRANDTARVEELTEKLNASESAKDSALLALEDMRKREHARRINAVKAAIKARFAEIKANADADIADSACDELLKDEAVECYAKLENEDGDFVGEERACRDVDSICMNSVIKAGMIRRENAQHRYVFDPVTRESKKSDAIDDALNRIGD